MYKHTHRGRTQDLEEEQPSVEQELRRLMDKPGEVFREIISAQCIALTLSSDVQLKYFCVHRTLKNIPGQRERKAAHGQTSRDCK